MRALGPTDFLTLKSMVPTMSELPASTLPRLNEPAPDFQANTTQGPRRLTDYRGKWLILFSHPGDFTPVCTSEFLAFAQAFSQFQAAGCELLGLSVDSAFAHLAWVRNIQQHFGIDIPFPIIDDLSMKVASAYGMIMPGASDTSAVRATFFIDPEGIMRAIIYYPMTCGRSIDEILRILRAMQTSDEHRVSTPAGWQPGDKVLVQPPATADAASKRLEEGLECVDWYFCKRDLRPKP